MTAGATPTAKQAYLQTFANELIENIAESIPIYDLDSLRSLRLVCRNVTPIATEIYAQRRFKRLRINATRATVLATTKLFTNPTYGKAVKDVMLHFNGSHTDASSVKYVDTHLKNLRDPEENHRSAEATVRMITAHERKLPELQAKFQAAYDEDMQEIDLCRMLAAFPNMCRLELVNLNRVTLQSKLPLVSLAAAITHSGAKLTTLELNTCELTSDDLARFLSIFHTTKKLVMTRTGAIADDAWAPIIGNILVHGKSLECLTIFLAGWEVRTQFMPGDSTSPGETSRDFQTIFRTFQNYRLFPKSVEASGALAIKYVCEKIMKYLVGDEGFEEIMAKCKKEANSGVIPLKRHASA